MISHQRIHRKSALRKAQNNSQTNDFPIIPHLNQPNGSKLIKCMICYTKHNKISDLRTHLGTHEFEIDFSKRKETENIMSISKQLFPEESTVLDEEELKKKISQDITCKKNMDRFYFIANKHGNEINLESSETETDSDDEPLVKLVSRSFQHKNVHKRIYSCEKCPEVFFTRKYQLCDHQIKAHTLEEAEHACVHCNVKFVSKELLELHYSRHCKNSHKKFLCEHCPLRFMWKKNLDTHTKMNHAMELEKKVRNCYYLKMELSKMQSLLLNNIIFRQKIKI